MKVGELHDDVTKPHLPVDSRECFIAHDHRILLLAVFVCRNEGCGRISTWSWWEV